MVANVSRTAAAPAVFTLAPGSVFTLSVYNFASALVSFADFSVPTV